MTDTTLRLGDFTFSDQAVPEDIEAGGDQQIVVHRLIGGTRVLDAMGPDPATLRWQGRFQGAQAESQVRQLERMRDDGQEQTLSWGSNTRSVLLSKFTWRWERFYQIIYQIEVTVSDVNTQQDDTLGFDSTISDLVGSDTLDALGLSDLIGDTTLGDAVGQLNGALGFVGALTGSTGIARMQYYLNGAQGAANGLFSIANGNVLSGAQQLLGASAVTAGGRLGTLVGNATQLANLTQMQGVLGRIGRGLGS